MSKFTDNLRDRASAIAERMSPRAKQWTVAGLVCGGGVALLWAVFSAGSGDSAQRAAAASAKSDVKPTNVDMMAPGAQVKDSEVWIGKAGKDLEAYKADKEEQKKLNREVSERQQEVLRRLAEMESRLKGGPQAASSPSMGPAATPQTPPPETALPRATASLPPAPPPPVAYPRGAMPPGVPANASPSGIDVAATPPQPQLMRVTLSTPTKAGEGPDAGKKPRDTLDSFLPISFTRGQLIGGLDAPTGGQSQSNPHPVLIRLSDNSVLPNRYRAEYRECFVIGAGYGDISSERAYIRTELLSCIRTNGDPLEVKIQGSIFGEDGKVGMRGRLVTKQGQMLANALLAGVVSGIGQGFSQANTTYSTSALGSVATASGGDAYRAGIGSGVGKALDRLAQYYIKLAEQTFPIIEVDAGREIDVVLTKGVRIDGGAPDAAAASPTSYPSRSEPSERYMKVSNDEE
ncbi:TrbI/VirB10 family protein [Piscinibacter defluvii]|uniref:TrbI/VirB10 family protein n=1 Tax=Piscinibacter defluvii TaxID=1796922 RepID=UPI000FDD7622|nr:TrbI/VirB10 family protein [Piscinibacter defluvii]